MCSVYLGSPIYRVKILFNFFTKSSLEPVGEAWASSVALSHFHLKSYKQHFIFQKIPVPSKQGPSKLAKWAPVASKQESNKSPSKVETKLEAEEQVKLLFIAIFSNRLIILHTLVSRYVLFWSWVLTMTCFRLAFQSCPLVVLPLLESIAYCDFVTINCRSL